MNFIQIAGRLGADPETRFTANGQKVTNIRVATNSRRGGKDETIWWRVSLWGDRFDKMVSYLNKGSAIIVSGKMHKPEVYTDKNGNPQVSIDVTGEMLEFSPFGRADKSEGSSFEPAQESQSQPAYYDNSNSSTPSHSEAPSSGPSNNNNEDFSMAYNPSESPSGSSEPSSGDDDGLPF